MTSTKKQTKKQTKKRTLIQEFKDFIQSEEFYDYNDESSYHDHNNSYRDINNGYGVELETGVDYDENRERLARFLNYRFNANVEEDSSINAGSYDMELISQPYTQEEWLDNKELIHEFFDLLNYNENMVDSSCGFHVHISKKLLGSNEIIRENNINKLILILENYKNEFIKFSRRDKYNLGYCEYYSNKTSRKLRDIYSIKKVKEYDHYSAINMDSKTYELRIFNATLDANTFIATLQLVFNLVDIVKQDDLTQYSFNDIINYNNEFSELIEYCNDNNIKNASKIIDKTKIKELLQLKENSKILKENYMYNEYISRIRTLILNNIELYQKSESDYNGYNKMYNDLGYIFTRTYQENNSMYYTLKKINSLLSDYSTKTIYNLTTGEEQDKRVFNQYHKTNYKEYLKKLENIIKEQGGEI